jgi:uncharacterized protein (TIGR03118 family)
MKASRMKICCALLLALSQGNMLSADEQFKVKNLVSNVPGIAVNTDPNLVNSWGLTFDLEGNLVVADNGTDLSTSYTVEGANVGSPITVSSAPTGVERNPSDTAFMISGFPAEFLFATEDGTILAFNQNVDPSNAIIVVDNSSLGSVYKGLAIAKSDGLFRLYATDFHNARVDVFDSNFNQLFSFSDSTIPPGFAPFNISTIHNKLYVTYAKQLAPDNEDDEAGPGNGFVDIFHTDGAFVKRLISRGALNSPWGLALAPKHFGDIGGKLLVGNFGNGIINVYNPKNGKFEGQLSNKDGVIVLSGLWAIRFNNKGMMEVQRNARETLFFTSGPAGETNGLVGSIVPDDSSSSSSSSSVSSS